MNFVLISNNLTSVVNFRYDLLRDIVEKGYSVHIFAPDIHLYPFEKQFLEENLFTLHEIRLERTSTSPFLDLLTIFDIFVKLRNIRPAVVLSYTIKPVIYGSIASFFANIPKRYALISGLGFAFQVHTDQRLSYFKKRIVYFLYKLALNVATKVFFQNKDDQELFFKIGILNQSSHSVVVKGSGVNTTKFYHAPLVENNQNNCVPIFLMIARLLKDKGIYEYIKAAEIIKKKYPEAVFNLVGWIDENPTAISQTELDKFIKEGIINYWGKLKDVRPAIKQSNIFVLPSYREGIPRSVLEAMSMGRAVITTHAPGCKDTVIEGQNGFKVNIQSVEELVHAMTYFINFPNMIRIMGKQSRLIVEKDFAVTKVNTFMIKEMSL